MKKIYAMLMGSVLAVTFLVGFSKYMDSKILENKAAIRNDRSYERFWSKDVQKMIMDQNTLPIFGSSELVSLSDYNIGISSFLNGSDMNIMTIGGGYFQSLNHTMELGAIADGIRSKKVALFLSPQWFEEGGIPKEAFPERFGEDNLLGFLEHPDISVENKKYVVERTSNLLEYSPAQCERVEKYNTSVRNKLSLAGIYTGIMTQYWDVRAKYDVFKKLDEVETEIPVVDLANLDFNQMLELAEKQGKDNCTNNEFGIMDDYWDTYVKTEYERLETEEKGKAKQKIQAFKESVEYDDLRCFLKVANELELEVILVSIPVNGKWYTYQGIECDDYYQNIRNIAGEFANVSLVDMSPYENEPYFLRDVMHLGWKGWTRINEALYHEFKE